MGARVCSYMDVWVRGSTRGKALPAASIVVPTYPKLFDAQKAFVYIKIFV